jgi:hypothetical protein
MMPMMPMMPMAPAMGMSMGIGMGAQKMVSNTGGGGSGTNASSRHVVPVIQPTKTETVNGITIITVQQGGAPPPPCTIFVGRIPNNLPDQTIRQFLDVCTHSRTCFILLPLPLYLVAKSLINTWLTQKCGRVVKWSRESDPTVSIFDSMPPNHIIS